MKLTGQLKDENYELRLALDDLKVNKLIVRSVISALMNVGRLLLINKLKL